MINNFINKISESIENQYFSKLTLSNYRGNDNQLIKIIINIILIKNVLHLSFVYRNKTNDVTKNYKIKDGLDKINKYLEIKEFTVVSLFTRDTIETIQYTPKKIWKATIQQVPNRVADLSHDKIKNRDIQAENNPYLKALGLVSKDGKVLSAAQDKFKQINHYISLLSPHLHTINNNTSNFTITDMGSGKGYLTFALYDYIKNKLGKDTTVIGVEYRKELVDLCNNISKNINYTGLIFEQGTIQDFQPKERLNMIIALHACDTATDDAIIKGIVNNAEYIVVAPCCHKQIRKAMNEKKADSSLQNMLQYGIYKERFCETTTDTFRTLILNHFGYSTKVVEFIDGVHTPKNVMIIAEKNKTMNQNNQYINALHNSYKTFGINHFYLEDTLISLGYLSYLK